MATSVKIVFRKEKMNNKGEAPLYLRIIKNRQPKYIALGVIVHKDNWDEENKRVKKGMQNSQRINNTITNKLAEAENEALALEKENKNISSTSIKENIMGKASPSFFDYSKLYLMDIKGKVTGSTYCKVEGVLKKIKEYKKDKDLTFEQLTTRWLKEYEHHMRNNLKNRTNTVYANMKIIRRIINEAVKDRIIKYDENPFLWYKYKWENVEKNFLVETEIALLENLNLQNCNDRLNDTRNGYVFSAYAGGLRISDVCKLKWIHFDGERIFLYTKKCKGVPVSIKLPQKAIDIIMQYYKANGNPNDFIFPFLNNEIDYSNEDFLTKAISSQDAMCNGALKIIAKKAGITKHLTFHTSRHTFATRALRKGMRIEYVSKIMGHGNIKTTQGYTKIVNEELDQAMEVFSEPKETYTLQLA